MYAATSSVFLYMQMYVMFLEYKNSMFTAVNIYSNALVSL